MENYIKNMLIGIFIFVAGGLIIGMILFLEPKVGDGKQTLVTRFSNINGLSTGTRVMFAGKPVGEVISIEQIPNARHQPTDELGQVYFYQLILKIDSSVKIYNTDEVTVQTSGLLGEKSIAIIPKAPPKGVIAKQITEKIPIYAESTDPIESAFNELSSLSDKFEEALDKITTWIDINGDEIGSAIKSFDSAMHQTATSLERVNKIKLIDDFKLSSQSFYTTMNDIHKSINKMNEHNTFSNIGVTSKNIQKSSEYFDIILKDFIKGRGTIGKLFQNEDTYLRINSILSKVNTLMNDINHYGILFYLNKQWQRTRLKQVNLLNALNTPEEFRNYFEKEIDLINTAMSRISMLITKTENTLQKDKILETKLFKEDFSELFRSTQELLNNLKLYNEKLSEKKY